MDGELDPMGDCEADVTRETGPLLGTPWAEQSLGPILSQAARAGSQAAGVMGLPPDPIPLAQVGQGRRHLVETLGGWAAPWILDARGIDFLGVANWRPWCIPLVTAYLAQEPQAVRALHRRSRSRATQQIATLRRGLPRAAGWPSRDSGLAWCI